MEFHNATLLPKGLPEIMAAVTPYDIYPETKVIAFRRKDGTGALGKAGYNQITDSFEVHLYPTLCCSNGGRRPSIGTFSFKLWLALLQTALHEIGHLARRDDYIYQKKDYARHYGEAYFHVEWLANNWMWDTLRRILRDNHRLGQPVGALTGYPGVLAYRLRNCDRPWSGGGDYKGLNEWRALGCGGQITMSDIACKLKPGLYSSDRSALIQRARVYRVIHRAAEAVGVRRLFVNKNGRRYLMFNAGEADAVWNWLSANVETVDRSIGIDGVQQNSDEDMGNLPHAPESETCPF